MRRKSRRRRGEGEEERGEEEELKFSKVSAPVSFPCNMIIVRAFEKVYLEKTRVVAIQAAGVTGSTRDAAYILTNQIPGARLYQTELNG